MAGEQGAKWLHRVVLTSEIGMLPLRLTVVLSKQGFSQVIEVEQVKKLVQTKMRSIRLVTWNICVTELEDVVCRGKVDLAYLQEQLEKMKI